MKKILFLLTILVSVPAFSQSADERIGTFLNQADWFGLEKNYPILKDSMQADSLFSTGKSSYRSEHIHNILLFQETLLP